ncbi:hypothetical protein ACFQZ8_21405, partial [Micromonospora azadirachtae]
RRQVPAARLATSPLLPMLTWRPLKDRRQARDERSGVQLMIRQGGGSLGPPQPLRAFAALLQAR